MIRAARARLAFVLPFVGVATAMVLLLGARTVQAKLGLRSASLANHMRAVTASRELRDRNSGNVELRVALAIALAGRGDAYAQFARRRIAGSGPADLAAAERDYAESVEILTQLQKENAIQGTDVQTLENNRAELEKVRKELNK